MAEGSRATADRLDARAGKVRALNRIETVAETLRATLNELATVAPAWLQAMAPLAWYERYGKRIEDTRLPPGQASRDAYAQMVGEDGFALLDALEATETPEHLRELPLITAEPGKFKA